MDRCVTELCTPSSSGELPFDDICTVKTATFTSISR